MKTLKPTPKGRSGAVSSLDSYSLMSDPVSLQVGARMLTRAVTTTALLESVPPGQLASVEDLFLCNDRTNWDLHLAI